MLPSAVFIKYGFFDFIPQVQVVDWMRGQTCGLCGKADGEIKEEYRTPSERLTKNAVSYAHSWVLPAKSCRDNSGNAGRTISNVFYWNLIYADTEAAFLIFSRVFYEA